MRGKKIKTLCIVFAMFLLAAVCVYCFHGKEEGKVKKAQEVQKDRAVSYASMSVSYSKMGCFYGDDKHRLLYLDAESGKETVACAKAGCKHQSHEENKDTECAADVYGFDSSVATTIIQQGQYVYLLYNSKEDDSNKEGISDYVLYRQNLDGSERKKMLVLKDTKTVLPYQIVCDGKWLVMSYTQLYQWDEKAEKMVDLEEQDMGLAVVNVEEKTCANYSIGKQCPAGSTGHVVDAMSIEGDELYFRCGYMDADYQMEQAAEMADDVAWKYEAEHRQGEIWQLSMKNGSIQTILAGDKITSAKIEGAKVLFQSDQKQMIGYADLSKKETEIITVKDIQLRKDDIRLDGIAGEDLYYHKYDTKSASSTYYVYHSETDLEEALPEPPKHYIPSYFSEEFIYFSVFDESGEFSSYSGHIASVSLQDFQKGNYAAKSDQQGKAAEDETASAEDTDTLVWGVCDGKLPDSKSVEEINQKLAERGFGKKVRFISVPAEDREQFSADYLKENYPELDILQVPGNIYYENRVGNLIHESYYENLQPYLQGEGRELYQSIHENSWKQVGMGNAIYTVPSTYLGYKGLYAVWNRKYISDTDQMAKTFTLEELEQKLAVSDVTSVDNPVVFISDPLSVSEDLGWLDGETNLGLYYGTDQQAHLWYQAEEVKELFQRFHRWYENGWLSEQMELTVWGEPCEEADKAGEEGKYVLVLGYGSIPEWLNEDEVVVQRIRRERLSHKLNLSTGVVASSDCKEEAESFLQLAYTDREIADLMFYGAEGTYQKEKGLVTERDGEFLDKVYDLRFYFGNQNTATPLADDPSADPDAAQAEYYADSERFYDSATLGFVADTRGYEETIQQLVELEEQYLNIWKSKNFEEEYQELCDKLKQKKYQEYVKEINRQIEEWKSER